MLHWEVFVKIKTFYEYNMIIHKSWEKVNKKSTKCA
ncbi:hypothetical protein RUMGNA_03102 [Mediterraneibacter gnavus ATCC 29149]|uniref:Uncharacterized protein n=1 Tax=Mediterraneibacter gnavus (strain ATCC 29149 / DSM 114966 / JCM 6515 / VPI C7-9) TaxID=411470 RepID=A7B689_MEDG7|nr:hypothetical protein RUMGNA_03102 [Mediterraneibacter gnavus ATCC 29149]